MIKSELIEEIELELGLLHQLLDESRQVIEAVSSGEDTPTERLGAGAMLQSFYNGTENIFCYIVERIDGSLPQGRDWRHKILPLMLKPTDSRKAVITEQLAECLKQYMDFREAFRYAHFYRLNWDSTKPLVSQCRHTLEILSAQLEIFLGKSAGKLQAVAADTNSLPPYWSKDKPASRETVNKTAVWIFVVGMSVLIGIALGASGNAVYSAWVAERQEAREQENPPSQSVRQFRDGMHTGTK